MKKLRLNAVLAGLLGIFALAACNKDQGEIYDPAVYLDAERPIIASYLIDEDLSSIATEFIDLEGNPTGIYYAILRGPGSEEGPFEYYEEVGSDKQLKNVRALVKYTGRLVPSGTQFETLENPDPAKDFLRILPTQTAAGVIYAWQVAFYPRDVRGILDGGLQIGDVIRIITPSPYAYGPQATSKVPANTPLDFEIEVVDLQEITN